MKVAPALGGLLALSGVVAAAYAEETQQTRLDEVSVTATREARATAQVPQAISVVGKEQMDQRKMFNVKEALQEIPGVLIDSKNGGFDARLIIRGAGLKAAYGIREIMVLRDGVPLTDPDSMTRLDFVDTLDIERIEVAKGPGNLFASGSAGGAIQIFSKSVFDQSGNNLRAGLGSEDTQNYHLRFGRKIGENQAFALTATHRKQDNDWRAWNQFDTTQTSVKHGFAFDSGDVLESEVSYSEANMQLPGSMDRALFDRFVASGEQPGTSEPWKHSGRYSKIGFFNTKLEMARGALTLKPRLYYNTWYHYHPVTGAINETATWVSNLGGDFEAQYRHQGGSLVGGVSLRQERAPDSRKYRYASVITTTSRGACVDSATTSARIVATCSDAKGLLNSREDSETLLTGIYLQESWRPSERWIIDAGGRFDWVAFDSRAEEFGRYDYRSGAYANVNAQSRTEKTFRLPAPKLAASYALADHFHAYAMVAQAGQVPAGSEISTNPSLDAAISRNHELGLKGRAKHWSLDASLYFTQVRDEIVQQNNGGVTTYLNAGRTEKKGFELQGRMEFGQGWETGAYLSLTDYTYKQFTELVSNANLDRAGKTLPFVPRQQYGLHLGWKNEHWRVRVAANSWGEYWLDNANTEKYEGWEWVTNLSVAYRWQAHSLTLNVDNLFDQHYAFEVKKDTSGKVTYAAAAPRQMMLTYRYEFK